MKFFFFALFVHFAWVGSAAAQRRASLEIITDGVDDDARQCGITNDTLRAPAVLTLRNNRVDVSSSDTWPYLYVIVTALPLTTQTSCVFMIGVQIRDSDAPKQRGKFRAGKIEKVMLCDRNNVGIAPKSDVSKRVGAIVEELVKHCLADVNY